jgi:flagellar protein FliL
MKTFNYKHVTAGMVFEYDLTYTNLKATKEGWAMVDKKDDDNPDDAKQKPAKGKGKGILIIIGILVLALAGGAFAYVQLTGGKGKAEAAKMEEKKTQKSALVALDPFVMNLSEQGRFLKVVMQFELVDAADQPMVNERTPQLRDAIITLVSSKSVDAVSSPEGKFQLKDELLLRANQAVGKDVFKNLYFTEFVMQ